MRLRAHPHYVAFIAVLLATSLILVPWMGLSRGVLFAFDGAVLAFMASVLRETWHADPAALRRHAVRNDAGQTGLIVVTAVLLLVVLTAVKVESNGARSAFGTEVMPLLTLALAWMFSNTVFALHYVRLYYRQRDGEDAGGLTVPGDGEPHFLEFCYFSFVIGMTFQVSDIEITDRDMRKVALAHSLIAFVFNVGVVALSVNILAGA